MRDPQLNTPSPRAVALAEQLRQAAEELIGVIERMVPERWDAVPEEGVWSPGKDAEHVADGAAYHQWIVRRSIGPRAGERPGIERQHLTAQRSQAEVVALLKRRTAEGADLIRELTEEQLALPPRPPRAQLQTLAELIEAVLIGHYGTHREAIESKLPT